jgi:hypothetical protein
VFSLPSFRLRALGLSPVKPLTPAFARVRYRPCRGKKTDGPRLRARIRRKRILP